MINVTLKKLKSTNGAMSGEIVEWPKKHRSFMLFVDNEKEFVTSAIVRYFYVHDSSGKNKCYFQTQNSTYKIVEKR